MEFLGRLIRFVFWVLLVSWVIKLVGRMFGRSNTPASQAGAAPGNDLPANGKRLVKDPVCGMHMAQELALPLNANNGETQYFCSPECREKYESSVLRRAANA